MNRGDIWYVDPGGKAGLRPVVILTRQGVINYLNKITVAEITTKGKGYPTEVFIGNSGNLPAPSWIQADNLHTVPKNRLIKYTGTLSASVMNKVSHKIILALELENLNDDFI